MSIYIHLTGDFFTYRLSRGVIIFFFLTLLLYYQSGRINRVLVTFMLFYGISSILTIWYEDATSATAAMIINLVAYLVLIISLIRRVTIKGMNTALLMAFVVLIGVNGYLLYELVLILKEFALNSLHYLFILLGSMALALVGFLALLYNHKHSSKVTLFFTFFVFLLIFSEVFRALGYYDIVYGDIAVYIARFLLIAALSMLLNHAIMDKKAGEQIGSNRS
ncbi:hypothetical protein POV27_19270 [Aureisphaera galaxeae]|uniref:hypothetical protein n=1 Tax=Aureisphaera galaxeae TaxID=1538023 RepID=UPI0023505CA9|nr:hypothetical protein [Aureisphaera galaxeae]MDC8006202.1 hypothetical protein [Aureisphaera galaxeae]